MRHLASVRKISEIKPIEGADAIVMVRVDGWECVAKKEEFKVGDLCVYFEIDSFLPLRPQYEHIRSRAYKKMGEKEGLRIKTIKLRGQISQGLALPVGMFIDDFVNSAYDEGQDLSEFFYLGNDLTEFLNVEKYEKPIPPQLAGQAQGHFPSFIKKTDQERCQNIPHLIFGSHRDERYEVTLKCDGSSFTGYKYQDRVGVCSRNLELKINDENKGNSFVRMFIDSRLGEVLAGFDRNIAVQGEIMGPGIQKNREQMKSTKLFVFDIYDIDRPGYLASHDRLHLLAALRAAGVKDVVSHVPIIHASVTLAELGITNLQELLAFADRPSINHEIAEGVVFKSLDSDFSFKVISNRYLLKEE